MNDVAIRVEGLGKSYRLKKSGGGGARYRTLRDEVMQLPRRLRGMFQAPLAAEDFWALRDVSFEVKRGEVLGVIGRNGAGKSTLLKILSRIVDPTAGAVDVYGRVGSLLEVGTGFHPELTGRENIFLSGAMLGMRRHEVRARLDEIVAFAEVENFLDTPCKHYSSGMYTRLGFAVAAHLAADILLVDEVLAVGDAEFQHRCLGKMTEVARGGRTVLVVSHNMATVAHLCHRGLWLNRGEVVGEGETSRMVAAYLAASNETEADRDFSRRHRAAGLDMVLEKLEILDGEGRPCLGVQCGSAVGFRLHYGRDRPIRNPAFGVLIGTLDGTKIFWCNSLMNKEFPEQLPGRGVVVCSIPMLPLVPGEYLIAVGCRSGAAQLDYLEEAARLRVYDADYFGTGIMPRANQGFILVNGSWKPTETML